MRDQMPKSKKDLNVERFPQLVNALAKDKEFYSISRRFSPDRAERLDAIIQKVAPTVEYTLSSSSKLVSQNFAMHLLKTPPDICCCSKTTKLHVYGIHQVQTSPAAVTHHQTRSSPYTISTARAHCPRATLPDPTSSTQEK